MAIKAQKAAATAGLTRIVGDQFVGQIIIKVG
jgi:hypothetical protein